MFERLNYVIDIIEEIGVGGFGSVYKVEVFNRKKHKCGEYALKCLSSTAALDETLIRRFQREVQYQANSQHKNIVPIYIHDLNNSQPWFVMELADTDVERCYSTLSVGERVRVIDSLLAAVKFMHDKNWLHRDIKLLNILKFGNDYKVSDFGLIKNTVPDPDSTQLTAIGQGMGTPTYAAPEVRAGHYSKQSDIYAIGICISELFENIVSLDKLDRIVDKCTQRRPSQRYQDISELVDAFNKVKEELIHG